MRAALGTAGVALGAAGCILGVVTILLGLRRRDLTMLRTARIFAALTLGGSVVAFAAMEWALLGHDFSLRYVAENGSRSTPTFYTFASLWAALEGSIILWSVVLSGYTFLAVRRFRDRADDPLVAWATVVLLAVGAFFFVLMLGPANPFRLVAGVTPADGPGPNPLLQNHPLMAIHPPFLYLGYVGFTVPFAFCVAALVTGRVGEGWLAITRRWTVLAWGFLTVGIVLGAWWSYEVLGWGGYWAWDPVENASFLPWLTATAYIHSVMVQERRGMLRVWNLSLLLATFSLTIFGTFLTRSGVLDSVHSFSESPIGPWLLSFFGVVVAVVLGLVAWRGDHLRSPGRIDSPLSREGAFLANNVLFAAFAFVVLLGTVFPLLHEAMTDEQITVGRPYFDRMTMPVGMLLLFLMAVAPVLPWRKASGELLRDRLFVPAWAGASALVAAVAVGARGIVPLVAFGLAGFAAGAALRQLVLAVRAARRRGASPLAAMVGRTNGGMIVHLGVVIVAVAFAASSSYSTTREVVLDEGETATVEGHTIQYLDADRIDGDQKDTIKVRVRVDGDRVMAPAQLLFPNATQPIGSPSVVWGLREDVYLTLVQVSPTGGPATIGVIIEPLVSWLWIGGGVMAVGTLLALVPNRRQRVTRTEMSAKADDEPAPELVTP